MIVMIVTLLLIMTDSNPTVATTTDVGTNTDIVKPPLSAVTYPDDYIPSKQTQTPPVFV